MPRFDEPSLTRPAADVCAERGLGPPATAPLPELHEPVPLPRVTGPVDEPLVPVRHPRVLVLEVYRLAGWRHARPGTWLRSSVMDRLGRAAASLPEPWGLCVFDAWRPLPLQAELYDAAYADPGLPPGFISEPDPDPATPPPHLTGGTIDASLTLDGVPLGLGTGFDDFTPRARTDALEADESVERDLRRWLYWTLHEVGFVVLDCEWWHFEHGTRRWAALVGDRPRYGPSTPPG